MIYLLDSNIFITSKINLPFDVYPSFWQAVSKLSHSGQFKSIKRVENELRKGKDEIVTWIDNELPKDFFIEEDTHTISALSSVSQWANLNSVYSDAAKNQFVSVADSWLVAEALAQSCTVVTFEKSQPNCKTRVKIPDVCDALGIKYCSLNDAFRALGVTI